MKTGHLVVVYPKCTEYIDNVRDTADIPEHRTLTVGEGGRAPYLFVLADSERSPKFSSCAVHGVAAISGECGQTQGRDQGHIHLYLGGFQASRQ